MVTLQEKEYDEISFRNFPEFYSFSELKNSTSSFSEPNRHLGDKIKLSTQGHCLLFKTTKEKSTTISQGRTIKTVTVIPGLLILEPCILPKNYPTVLKLKSIKLKRLCEPFIGCLVTCLFVLEFPARLIS